MIHPSNRRASTLRGAASTGCIPLVTDIAWEAGVPIRYTAGNGFTWHLTRWLDGTPSEWKVTRLAWGSDEEVIRRRAFGEDTGSALEPRMDGRGSPWLIEENDTLGQTGSGILPPGGRRRPDLFDQFEACINSDGSLRTK